LKYFQKIAFKYKEGAFEFQNEEGIKHVYSFVSAKARKLFGTNKLLKDIGYHILAENNLQS